MIEDMKMDMGNTELNPSELCRLHRGVVGRYELEVKCLRDLCVKSSLVLNKCVTLPIFCNIPVNSIPLGSQRSDKAHPNSADGHSPDEGAREGPGDAAGPPVQLGPLLCEHPRTEAHVAGQHGPCTPEERRSLRGAGTFPSSLLILLFCFFSRALYLLFTLSYITINILFTSGRGCVPAVFVLSTCHLWK